MTDPTDPIAPISAPVTPLETPTEAAPERTSTPPRPGMELPAPGDSYVKLAMRNMVAKGGQSLKHFGLTVTALLGLLVGLAYLTH
jgi:Protein of unknown function (DUF3285)